MKNLSSRTMMIATGMMLASLAQAGDMDSVVTYSMGEFDRVGVSQSTPKIQKNDHNKSQKSSVAGLRQNAQERQLAAQKAEFLRRMFWLALVAR